MQRRCRECQCQLVRLYDRQRERRKHSVHINETMVCTCCGTNCRRVHATQKFCDGCRYPVHLAKARERRQRERDAKQAASISQCRVCGAIFFPEPGHRRCPGCRLLIDRNRSGVKRPNKTGKPIICMQCGAPVITNGNRLHLCYECAYQHYLTRRRSDRRRLRLDPIWYAKHRLHHSEYKRTRRRVLKETAAIEQAAIAILNQLEVSS